MALQYITCCVDLTRQDVGNLQDMIDRGRRVSYRTARTHIGKDALAEVFPDYAWWSRKRGELTMKRDWHVRYFKSVYRGKPVYFVVHSAIEYIFG